MKRLNQSITCLILTASFSLVYGQGLATLLGDGNAGSGCAPGSAIRLNSPSGVAIDVFGNLYAADTVDNCVLRVKDGFLVERIGTGAPGFSEGNGDPTKAELYWPRNLAVDVAGNLYIADSFNNRIRKVDTNGVISTVAGGGSTPAVDGTVATQAQLVTPQGVAVDPAGSVFFSDGNTQRVFKIDANGLLKAVAGSGFTGTTYNGVEGGPALSANMVPLGLAFDPAGNLHIADWANSIIRKVDSAGNIRTVAGNPFSGSGVGDGGPAAFGAAHLSQPRSIAFDSAGNLYIADTGNNRVRKVDTGGIIHTIAGTGTAGYGQGMLNFPAAVAVDAAGSVFIADARSNTIQGIIVSPSTHSLTISVAGTGSGVVGGAGTYNTGQTATVTAVPNSSSTFGGWSGLNSAECAAGSVVMNADKSCTATFTLSPVCAVNMSASLPAVRSGFAYNFASKRFSQTVTVTNNSGSPVAGPISLVIDSLSNNAGLFNGSGITSCNTPAGPYLDNTAASLAPGASVSFALEFTDPTRTAIIYNTRVLAGPGIK